MCYISRQLQLVDRKEQDIQQFFEQYGPSARDCYAFCATISDYHAIVCHKVKRMGWKFLTTVLTSGAESFHMDEGSHKVILISPDPENRTRSLPSIITKTVVAILYEQDTQERWRNAHNLYRTLRQDPKMKSSSGWLLEPPFHALCVKGFKFKLYPMVIKPGGRVNDIFTDTAYVNTEDLVLPRQTRIIYNTESPVQSLDADHYYQPAHGTQASFDSFIYDPNVNQITMFQITTGHIHEMKPKGINFLRQLAEWLRPGELKLRYVAVVPEGHKVECPLAKAMDFTLDMWSLEVMEGELFGEDG